MTLADYGDTHVFPDNWPAVELFATMQTQWRTGNHGPYGLDYNVLYHRMDRMNLTPDRYNELEACIRLMESEALDEMRD